MENGEAATATARDATPANDGSDRTEELAALADRVSAVERAVAAGGREGGEATAGGERNESAPHPDELRERVEDLHERLDELDAAVQALRGYAGGVRAVNEEVERRADLALATARKATEAGRTEPKPSESERTEPGRTEPEQTSPSSEGTETALERATPDQPAVAAAVPDGAGSDFAGDGGARRPDSDPSRQSERGVLDRLRDAL